MAKSLPPTDYLILHSYNTIAESQVNYNCSNGFSAQLLYSTHPIITAILIIVRCYNFFIFSPYGGEDK